MLKIAEQLSINPFKWLSDLFNSTSIFINGLLLTI